jgi:hypothetical protein
MKKKIPTLPESSLASRMLPYLPHRRPCAPIAAGPIPRTLPPRTMFSARPATQAPPPRLSGCRPGLPPTTAPRTTRRRPGSHAQPEKESCTASYGTARRRRVSHTPPASEQRAPLAPPPPPVLLAPLLLAHPAPAAPCSTDVLHPRSSTPARTRALGSRPSGRELDGAGHRQAAVWVAAPVALSAVVRRSPTDDRTSFPTSYRALFPRQGNRRRFPVRI